MDPLYVHLLINHAPLIGLIGCVLLLIAALITRSRDLGLAGLVGLVLVALVAIPVYLTGEPAEEAVEHLPGFSHDAIEEHEDAALFAIISAEVAGAVALLGLILARKRAAVPRGAIIATLLIALFSLSVIARTAYLGGKIRHTEVGAAAARQSDD